MSKCTGMCWKFIDTDYKDTCTGVCEYEHNDEE